MKSKDIPSQAEDLKATDWLGKVEEDLQDVEFYSPTLPLHWSHYHAIIERLLKEVRKPEAGHGDGI